MELDYQLIDCGNHNDTPVTFHSKPKQTLENFINSRRTSLCCHQVITGKILSGRHSLT